MADIELGKESCTYDMIMQCASCLFARVSLRASNGKLPLFLANMAEIGLESGCQPRTSTHVYVLG
jgi:hypothetical protein